MGRVYEARHQRLTTKRFAVKMLHPDLARQPDVVTRFSARSRSVERDFTPARGRRYDVSSTPDGRPYIVAELSAGRRAR